MGTNSKHCSPCFLVAKPGSTAKRLVVDYEELNKKTLNDSGSIPNMESTLEKIAYCRYKTTMDKRSGFWQVDLTPNAQELSAFINARKITSDSSGRSVSSCRKLCSTLGSTVAMGGGPLRPIRPNC